MNRNTHADLCQCAQIESASQLAAQVDQTDPTLDAEVAICKTASTTAWQSQLCKRHTAETQKHAGDYWSLECQ